MVPGRTHGVPQGHTDGDTAQVHVRCAGESGQRGLSTAVVCKVGSCKVTQPMSLQKGDSPGSEVRTCAKAQETGEGGGW